MHLKSGDREVLEQVRRVLLLVLAQQLSPTGAASSDGATSGAAMAATPPTAAALERAEEFLHKQFITPADWQGVGDAWALYTLAGTGLAPSIDMKFVQRLKRPFQFAADSFRIDLGAATTASFFAAASIAAEKAADRVVKPKLQPKAALAAAQHTAAELSVSIQFHSSYLSVRTAQHCEARCRTVSLSTQLGRVLNLNPTPLPFCEQVTAALEHLEAREIAIIAEADMAEVRGGGLLKYARFIARGWKVAPAVNRSKLQRYMVNRFLMDFPQFQVSGWGVPVQVQRIASFLENHVRVPHRLVSIKPSVERTAFFDALEQTIIETSIPSTGQLINVVRFSRMAHGCNPSKSVRGRGGSRGGRGGSPRSRRKGSGKQLNHHQPHITRSGNGSSELAPQSRDGVQKRPHQVQAPPPPGLSPQAVWPCMLVATQQAMPARQSNGSQEQQPEPKRYSSGPGSSFQLMGRTPLVAIQHMGIGSAVEAAGASDKANPSNIDRMRDMSALAEEEVGQPGNRKYPRAVLGVPGAPVLRTQSYADAIGRAKTPSTVSQVQTSVSVR